MKGGRKYIFKYLTGLILLLIVLFSLKYSQELNYALGQLSGQLDIIRKSKDINIFMNDPDFPSEYKDQLKFIEEVKTFAQEELGLEESDNYTTLFDQKGKDILWNVTASDRFTLKAYTWSFPFAGSFPYKGFFNREKAEKEYKERLGDSLDVSIRPVSAWSTLGYFSDPILSNMLDRTKGELAELIIHEMTHATLYVKDDISFNENLATFIGEHGAKIFLETEYGKTDSLYINYVTEKLDDEIWVSFMMQQSQVLDSLYMKIQNWPIEKKEKEKLEFMERFVLLAGQVPFLEENKKVSLKTKDINNTFFLSYLRYHSGKDSLDSLYQHTFDEDFHQMISYFREKYK